MTARCSRPRGSRRGRDIMSEQPGRGSWTDRPSAPGVHVPAVVVGPGTGEAAAGPLNGQGAAGPGTGEAAAGPADGEGAGSPAVGPGCLDRPGRTSDLGRFDWFAEADQFALSGLSARAPAPPLPANAPAKKRRLRPRWRAVAVSGLVLASTALGAVVRGLS